MSDDDDLLNSPSFIHFPDTKTEPITEINNDIFFEEKKSINKEQKETTSWLQKNWKYGLGFIITIGLMAVLIWQSNPAIFWACLLNVNIAMLLGALGITIALFVIKTIRWQMILRIQGTKLSLWMTLRLVLIGTFGSSITPAKVGDILRAFYLTKEEKTKIGKSVFTVVFDRILDLVGIFLIAGCTTPFLLLAFDSIEWWIPAAIAGGFLILIVICALTFTEKISRPILVFVLKIVSKAFRKQEAKDKINISSQEIIDDFFTCQKKYQVKHYLFLGALSIIFWIILGLQGSLLLVAFGTPNVNPIIIISVLCIAAVVAMTIPFSIGGVGIRDLVISSLLLLILSINSSFALNLSIMQTILNVVLAGIIGGIIILTTNKTREKRKKEL
ncbi:MAG: lysylphosphatidylglycerol synthase transmembrane domain-containing protein [Candidatus Heimdallarchaeota archaeon]